MKEIVRSQWNYMLRNYDGKLVFSVICGSIGLYEINIVLNDYETGKYNTSGEKYLKEFAEHIRNNPEMYRSRYVDADRLG